MQNSTPKLIQAKLPLVKLCECGCGQPAPIAKKTRTGQGHIKGQPIRFISGHNGRKGPMPEPPNPSGLCMCGCGQKTSIAKLTSTRNGWIEGEPIRFIHGHHPRIEPTKHFWANIDKKGPIHPVLGTRCWIWKGSLNEHGYGLIKGIRTHRFSWELHYGPIPEDMNVLHKCDNPNCPRPDHLFLGTQQDNVADMVAKRRHNLGRRNGSAKLTESDIPIIREMRQQGQTYTSIGDEFGVSEATIRDAVNYRTWSHVE